MIYEDIKEQFKKVISYSQNIDFPQVDELFDRWLEAKRDIIEAFCGKLIYEVPTKVHFTLDEKERTSHFNSFVDDISNIYHNYQLVDFLNANADGFYNNTIKRPYECGGIKVPSGMKLVNAFKYFENDKNLLEQFQIQASQVIQEDKVEGTLCFSVHPLDFLSTSVNTYNWRSCHALDGEYRAGNLSYMVDKSTIVCYLKGADNVRLDAFPYDVPWNSKKWRVLLYLSDKWDMIMAGKQYPFPSKNGLDQSLEHLLKALNFTASYSEWRSDYFSSITTKDKRTVELRDKYLLVNNNLHKMREIVENGENALQFNDLLRSTSYIEPYYSVQKNYLWFFDGTPHFTIGEHVKCLHCGENIIGVPELMVCRYCAEDYDYFEDDDDAYTCDCCGCRIADNCWHMVDDELICDNCYDTECYECERCGEIHFNSNKVYDRETKQYVCNYCYEQLQEERK